jgi:hypothetical protein
MPTIDFPGGAIGNFGPSFFLDTNDYIQQELVGFPNAAAGARVNIDGNYAIRVASISPDRLTGTNSVAIVYAGVLRGVGSVILSSTNPATTCAVRVTKTGGSSTTFRRDNVSTNAVVHYRGRDGFTGGDYGAYPGRLSGSWIWNTVPSAPASISTSLSGTNVTVTRGNSSDNGGATITGYTLQRRESTNGTSFGSWGNNVSLSTSTLTHTYTNLTPARYYQFRVYANNNAGSSQTRTSGTIFVAAITRFTGTAFTVLSKLRKHDGSNWQNVTQVRRWNGTSWVTIDITGINST